MTDAEWEALQPYAKRYDAARTAYQALMMSNINVDLRTRTELNIQIQAALQELTTASIEFDKAQKDILHADR